GGAAPPPHRQGAARGRAHRGGLCPLDRSAVPRGGAQGGGAGLAPDDELPREAPPPRLRHRRVPGRDRPQPFQRPPPAGAAVPLPGEAAHPPASHERGAGCPVALPTTGGAGPAWPSACPCPWSARPP